MEIIVDKFSAVLIIIAVILTGLISTMVYRDYYNQCTANPLVYASNKWVKEYGHELYGEGTFKDAKNRTFKVEFDSSGVRIIDPSNSGRVTSRELTQQQLDSLFENISKIVVD